MSEERLYGLFQLVTPGELTVATQLVQDGWAVVESAPKTDSGERVITLDEYTEEVLDAHELKQDAERAAWGEA